MSTTGVDVVIIAAVTVHTSENALRSVQVYCLQLCQYRCCSFMLHINTLELTVIVLYAAYVAYCLLNSLCVVHCAFL